MFLDLKQTQGDIVIDKGGSLEELEAHLRKSACQVAWH